MTPPPSAGPPKPTGVIDNPGRLSSNASADPVAAAATATGRSAGPLRSWITRRMYGRPGGRRGQAWGSDDGRVTAFTAVFAAAALLFAGLVLDGGLALAAKVRAVGEAQEAARAGAQAIDLDAYRASGTLRLQPDRAATLARGYLTSTSTGNGADAGADPGAVVEVSADAVTVTVTTSQSTRLLGLVGIHSIRITGRGTAHPDRGLVAGTRSGP
jgi:hypothetical protein